MAVPAKKCPVCKKGTPLWMVSWADMVTLLLCLFIILLTYSTTNKVKFEEVSGSMKDAFGVQKSKPISPVISGYNPVTTEFNQEIVLVRLVEKLQLVMDRLIDSGLADLTSDDDGFLLQFKTDALFEAGTTTIRKDMEPVLQQFANVVFSVPNQIVVTAFAAKPSEWPRAAAQSASVASMLTTQGNLDPHRLQAVAVGTSANDAAQKNKKLGDSRIEIMVTKKNPPLMDSADH